MTDLAKRARRALEASMTLIQQRRTEADKIRPNRFGIFLRA